MFLLEDMPYVGVSGAVYKCLVADNFEYWDIGRVGIKVKVRVTWDLCYLA